MSPSWGVPPTSAPVIHRSSSTVHAARRLTCRRRPRPVPCSAFYSPRAGQRCATSTTTLRPPSASLRTKDPHRQSRAHPEPDGAPTLEASGPGDLAERTVAVDLGRFPPVRRRVRRLAVVVAGGCLDDDAQAGPAAERHPVAGAVLDHAAHVLDLVARLPRPAPLRTITSRSKHACRPDRMSVICLLVDGARFLASDPMSTHTTVADAGEVVAAVATGAMLNASPEYERTDEALASWGILMVSSFGTTVRRRSAPRG